MGNHVVQEWRSLPAWLRYGVIIILVLGIFFRFYNLDKKVYWIDETNSSLRSLGYTKTEFIENVFTGEVVTADTLQQYQRPDPERGWDDTMNALMGTAEHTPLYFMLSRAWVNLVGHSVTTMRLLTAILSVLVLPVLFWLCRQLFESPAVAWISVALVSVSPLHVLYAQEARPYSLVSLLTVLSSALLIRAMRSNQRRNWVLYGITITAGLYTHLLFSLVAMAHGLYVLLAEKVIEKRQLTKSTISYLIAAGASFLALTPWIILLINNLEKVQASTRSLSDQNSLSYMIDHWFLNASRIFIDRELGGLNLIFVLLSFYGLFFLWRKGSRNAWLLVGTLVGVTFLTLVVPDLLLGGRRSIRIRYLFPPVIGVQMAVAFLFATQAVWARTWGQKAWRLLLVLLITGGIFADIASAQATVWWSKSVPRSSYYIPVAEIINQSNNPLVISDGPVTDTLSFSAWLEPDVHLQLALRPGQIRVPDGFDPIFLLNPSKQLRNRLTRQGYQLTEAYEDPNARSGNEYPLWSASK